MRPASSSSLGSGPSPRLKAIFALARALKSSGVHSSLGFRAQAGKSSAVTGRPPTVACCGPPAPARRRLRRFLGANTRSIQPGFTSM